MPRVIQRTRAVKKLLDDDVAGLNARTETHSPCPLRFQLVSSALELKESEFEACIGLVERTSGDDYRASSIGWNTRKKKDEMMDKEMLYLLVRQGDVEVATGGDEADKDHVENSSILGFISFMFTWDDPPHEEREVVYIYEIHLDESLRGKGLGSRLIGFVEHVARECQVEKTMLTVFTANEGAKNMYEKLGYDRDECSPHDRVMRNKIIKPEYVIMSKTLV
ncbi:flavin-containing monooxygenase [Stemphylium lycopersici]|uniref:N-alpha-acetyltransferase 40 n=1 Tax=Stemphylium lycopersici TaxID=183478 RepID=A0A364N3I8_STELY|nr:flavin-containing monooxygenase [Stemphylium lycopersici]RAR11077.1 flavin-containing monooxygenase [Stemphylium lycopersici]